MTGDPADQLREFTRAVYGGCAGLIEVAYFLGRSKKASHIPVDLFLESSEAILELSQEGWDVYLGCVTLGKKPDKGRGKSPLRLDVPGVWLDLDLDVDGHHKPADTGLRRLRDSTEAQELLDKTGLPEPTALLSSGGGLYAWWLYHEPLTLWEDDLDSAGAITLSDAVNTRVADVAREMGVAIDRTSDVVRVLRPPGSLNWKGGVAGVKPVTLLYLDEELRILPEELAARVEDVGAVREVRRATARDRSVDQDEDGDSLPDAAKAASWEQILFPLGWTYGAPITGGTTFLRPGHTDTVSSKPGDDYRSNFGVDEGAKSAGVYDDGPEVLVVWSDACGLPSGTGQKLTKFRVMSHLWFHGSMGATSRDLGNAALARAAGACSGVDEDGAGVQSVWPGCVLEKALTFFGGGWKSGEAGWVVHTAQGSVHVRKPRVQ